MDGFCDSDMKPAENYRMVKPQIDFVPQLVRQRPVLLRLGKGDRKPQATY